MKKLTRISKAKILETVKTVLIVFLSAMCLLLGYQIFQLYREQTSNPYWGTNQGLITQYYDNGETTAAEFAKYSYPELILVSHTNSRVALRESTEEFNDAAELCVALMKEALSKGQDVVRLSSLTEWQNSARTNSIYARFPSARATAFETGFYDIKDSGLGSIIEEYDSFLVVPENNDSKNLTVLVRSLGGDKFAKAVFESEYAEKIRRLLYYSADNSEKQYAFAYELNLDNLDNAAPTVLDSMLAVPVSAVDPQKILAKVPKTYTNGLNFSKTTDFAMSLINIFGYNQNTIREYSGGDGELIFVAETGNLSVHPEGRIEYSALDANDGVVLTSDFSDAYEVVSGLFDVFEKLFFSSGIPDDKRTFDIRFSSMPKQFDDSRQEICFDYYINGLRVAFSDEAAIRAVVEKGALVELKIQMCEIERLNKLSECKTIFDAIDDFKSENPKVRHIRYGKQIYKAAENDKEIPAQWEIRGEE